MSIWNFFDKIGFLTGIVHNPHVEREYTSIVPREDPKAYPDVQAPNPTNSVSPLNTEDHKDDPALSEPTFKPQNIHKGSEGAVLESCSRLATKEDLIEPPTITNRVAEEDLFTHLNAWRRHSTDFITAETVWNNTHKDLEAHLQTNNTILNTIRQRIPHALRISVHQGKPFFSCRHKDIF